MNADRQIQNIQGRLGRVNIEENRGRGRGQGEGRGRGGGQGISHEREISHGRRRLCIQNYFNGTVSIMELHN